MEQTERAPLIRADQFSSTFFPDFLQDPDKQFRYARLLWTI